MNNKAPNKIGNNSKALINALIVDATEHVDAIVENKKVPQTVIDNPVLVAAHALASLLNIKLERIASAHEGQCIALEKIAGKLDFIDGWHARGEDVDAQPDDEVVPTAYESERMLGVLKVDWLRQHSGHTQVEYRDAMRRFEILAGL